MKRLSPDEILKRLRSLSGPRKIVAIAGPPGSGKSTLAEWLADQLGARAAILPMDGYHFDDRVLESKGRLANKGAPDTFDAAGLAAMIRRLRANEEPEIAIPVFDREIEIARAGAALIPHTADLVLVEGNYILADCAPWSALTPLFDLRALVRVSEPELTRRLRRRWEGYNLSEAAIRDKLEQNDLPNGRFVYEQSLRAELEIDGETPFATG